jgi:hypothetical protein
VFVMKRASSSNTPDLHSGSARHRRELVAGCTDRALRRGWPTAIRQAAGHQARAARNCAEGLAASTNTITHI